MISFLGRRSLETCTDTTSSTLILLHLTEVPLYMSDLCTFVDGKLDAENDCYSCAPSQFIVFDANSHFPDFITNSSAIPRH